MKLFGFKVERIDTDQDLQTQVQESTALLVGKGLEHASNAGSIVKGIGRGLFNGIYEAINK